jgi:acyl-CoA thioester hydrolase
MQIKNQFFYKVYFEDTDAGGVVYYANYLKFLERARTDFLDQSGLSSKHYYNQKIFFAVKKMDAEYIKPLFYGEMFICEVFVKKVKNASFELTYNILKNEQICFKANTTIVSITKNFKVIKIPEKLKIFLKNNITLWNN